MNGVTLRLSALSYWKLSGLSFVLGLLLATTFAPLHLVFFLPVCFSGMLVLLSQAPTRWQAFFIGWWFGWGQFMAGLYWIGVAFTIDAQAHAALLPLPVMGLPAFLAIYCGLATLITYLLKASGMNRVLIFSGLWVLAEYARGALFTGFPWNLAGYAWGDVLPMLQWVAFIGIYGLTLMTVLISSLPALLAEKDMPQKSKNTAMLITCGLLAGMVGIGYIRLQADPLPPLANSTIRLVQPNIAQADKWKPDLKFGHVKRLTEMSIGDGSDSPPPRILIWPETAVPFFLTTDNNLKFYLQRFIRKDGALVTGAPRKDTSRKRYWNSVQTLASDGSIVSIYDKRHLVPYGEYLPLHSFLKASGLASLIPVLDQMSSFSKGAGGGLLSVPGLPPAAAFICYEVAFPWEVQTGPSATWILNVTNDGWFGNTSGPYQHLVITRTRAIEQGKSVVRAANTGISTVIDGYGRIKEKLPLNSQGILDSTIPSPLEQRTLYQQAGEYLPSGLSLLLIVVALFRHRQNRNEAVNS